MIKIARIAVTLGLLSSLGAQAYAAGLVVNDNDLRNDLAWLSDRGVIHLSLSTWPLSQEEIVGSVGAGDAFCAGLLYGSHENWTLIDSIKLAHACARASLLCANAIDGAKTLAELTLDIQQSH
mgnify:CR=1 FL=1